VNVPVIKIVKRKIKVCVKIALMKGEKKMYSPKVSEEHVKKLWKLKSISEVITGERKPMTEMVNEAIGEYLKKESKKVKHLLRDKDMATISLQLMDTQP
jgi:hypothetical protein